MNTSLPQSRPADDKEKVKLLDPKKEECVKEDGDQEMFTRHEVAGNIINVFRTNDCIHILHTELETLAATNMNISPSVVNRWASILNYEERYRNRDSPRRFFFSTEMMSNPWLRMRSVDAKTQYDIFRKNLSKAARYHGSIIKMKDIDLAFFPMLDDAKTWRTGLVEKGQRHQTQLEDLMKKYVAKLTLHDHNLVKNAMMKEVERFNSMEVDIKARILLQANESRFGRLI
ncbi:hypothetical protein L6452_03076 [Arctium lappa]|uniref:Uncharacterized protein n=1 Tax=Arctium lappa TaxID=4217 RepID=A0ACB9FLC4_ARCLA|nr:hypothetical protein L6452_03076 [Arctium lappa]